jgi:hypothetical protein
MRRMGIAAALAVLAAGSLFQGLASASTLPPKAAPSRGAHWLAQAQAPKRSALVIGNGAYEDEALANAVNDAEDVARTLREIGFQVTLLRNADKRTINEAVDSFRRQLSQGDYGLFYFSGHGIQVAGENYLIPLKANLSIEANVKYDGVPLGTIINAVEASRATARIIIIDACRDNPFYRRWGSINRSLTTRGLANPIVSGRGTLIAFSTAPDQKAEDGIGGRNSPFTTYLLRHLKASNLDVRLMLGKVREDVLQATQNKQIPWTNESLTGEVYLNPKASQSPTPAAPSSDSVVSEPGPSMSSPPAQSELPAQPPPRPAQLAVSSLNSAGPRTGLTPGVTSKEQAAQSIDDAPVPAFPNTPTPPPTAAPASKPEIAAATRSKDWRVYGSNGELQVLSPWKRSTRGGLTLETMARVNHPMAPNTIIILEVDCKSDNLTIKTFTGTVFVDESLTKAIAGMKQEACSVVRKEGVRNVSIPN